MNWIRGHAVAFTLAGALALAAASGFLASTAFSQEGQPTRTVTINVGTGPQGDPGPPGPAGPAGAQTCPAGFTHSIVIFNAPGGQQTIATCLKD